MQDLQKEQGMSYLFITHDLSVVKHISDQILVMYLGQTVETCPAKELFRRPLHPYTQALLSAIPVPEIGANAQRILLKGEITSPIEPKPDCRFAPRCTYAVEACTRQEPALRHRGGGHFVACHRVEELAPQGQ